MDRFHNLKLGPKIASGLLMIGLVFLATVLLFNERLDEETAITARALDLRAPTLQNSTLLRGGLNRSLAALRGWMLLDNEDFKAERQAAWEDEVAVAEGRLELLSADWTDPDNISRLERIRGNLKTLKSLQKEIEDISHTEDNEPALKLLFSEAVPQANVLTTSITRMIDLEARQPATSERKALLGAMADVRGTTGLALAALRIGVRLRPMSCVGR